MIKYCEWTWQSEYSSIVLTFTVLHKDENLPHTVSYCVDDGVQVAHYVLMAWQLFLFRPKEQARYRGKNTPTKRKLTLENH